MTVTKLNNSAALMTTELINGTTLVAEASTNDPFGTTVVQTFGGLTDDRAAANPDVRIFMKGPSGGLLTGLVEDLSAELRVRSALAGPVSVRASRWPGGRGNQFDRRGGD